MRAIPVPTGAIEAKRNGGQEKGFGHYSWTAKGTLQTSIDAVEIWWTNDIPLRSTSRVAIRSEAFAAVAQAMMEVNPAAAIKAFGAALQTVDTAEIGKAPAAA